MPNLTFQGSPDGPLVDVRISPSSQYQRLAQFHNRALPPSIQATFLLDTGASHCMVDADVIAPLGLQPRATSAIRTATGGRSAAQYDLSLLIHDAAVHNRGQAWQIDAVPVTGVGQKPFGGAPYVGVIGRDVLDRGLLIYNGLAQQIILSW